MAAGFYSPLASWLGGAGGPAGTLTQTVEDTVALTDTATGALGHWEATPDENLAVTDTATGSLATAGFYSPLAFWVGGAGLVPTGFGGGTDEPVVVTDTGAGILGLVGGASDAVGVGDTAEGVLGSWHRSVAEPVTVSDAGEGSLFDTSLNLTATTDDAIAVVDQPVGYSLHRPIFVTDAPTGALSLVTTLTESVTVTDGLAPVLGDDMEGTASDTITVSETTGNELSTLILVTDTAVGSLAMAQPSQLVTESVTVTDTPLPDLGANNLQGTPTAESVTVTDSGTGRLGNWYATATEPATVTDTVTEAELFVVESPLTRSVSEPVAVTETGRGFLTSPAVVSDILRVPYERRMWRIEHEARTRVVPYERRVWRIRRRTQR